MTTIELEQHPEMTALIIALSKGERVDIQNHGNVVGFCAPAPTISPLRKRLMALHSRFTSPVYPGSEVVDMRRTSSK